MKRANKLSESYWWPNLVNISLSEATSSLNWLHLLQRLSVIVLLLLWWQRIIHGRWTEPTTYTTSCSIQGKSLWYGTQVQVSTCSYPAPVNTVTTFSVRLLTDVFRILQTIEHDVVRAEKTIFSTLFLTCFNTYACNPFISYYRTLPSFSNLSSTIHTHPAPPFQTRTSFPLYVNRSLPSTRLCERVQLTSSASVSSFGREPGWITG